MRNGSGCGGRVLAAAAVLLALGSVGGGPRAAGPSPGAAPSGAHASLLDVGQDVVVDRAFVPSAERPQGEVRIVRRGKHVVVQTLLYTRVIKRVFGAIGGKERRNWPEGKDGHADMERYLAALDEFQRAARAKTEGKEADAERRINALIEFIDAEDSPIVAVGGAEIDGTGDKIRVRGRTAPSVLELSAGYVRRNMRLIVADAFHVPLEEAAARLARASGA